MSDTIGSTAATSSSNASGPERQRSWKRLSHLLLVSHMGVLLLFAVLLLVSGAGTFRNFVFGQARAEAERSASDARRRLQEWRRELNLAGELLAEQPTLQFYLQRDQLTKARELIAEFHATSDVGYLRVQLGDRTVSELGSPPPRFGTGLTFDAEGATWRVVHRNLPIPPSAHVVVAERLGKRLNRGLPSGLISVELRPLSAPSAEDAWTRSLLDVAATGEPETFENIGGAAAVRVVRYRDEGGEPSALLLARVEHQWVEGRIVELWTAFGAVALVTGGLALAMAVLLASRISRPFAQLARDAQRLGSGDLETPVPAPKGVLAEPAALAASLERMRQRVATLTATERAQREELDLILDAVDEGIAGVDEEHRIHYANRQLLSLLGLSREEVLGQPLHAVIVPASAFGTGVEAGSATVLPPVGRYSPAHKARPLTVRGRVAGGGRQVLIVRDENAIEAARALRDHILANLSHEFQTPLSAQIASIELLRDHLRGSQDRGAIALADALFRGTVRLSHLVDNLLESVRIESGEMRLRRQPVDLAAVVADALELMQPLIDQRDQRIVSVVEPGPMLVGDTERLFSVMVNLLANANKFAPDQSTIHIQLEWTPTEAIVWVRDEGPGLPPTLANSDLFAPFKRAANAEPDQRGTGLGLAIVYAIVTAHGGAVRVACPDIGCGAHIGIALPLQPVANA